jgi:hypothetical protein
MKKSRRSLDGTFLFEKTGCLLQFVEIEKHIEIRAVMG